MLHYVRKHETQVSTLTFHFCHWVILGERGFYDAGYPDRNACCTPVCKPSCSLGSTPFSSTPSAAISLWSKKAKRTLLSHRTAYELHPVPFMSGASTPLYSRVDSPDDSNLIPVVLILFIANGTLIFHWGCPVRGLVRVAVPKMRAVWEIVVRLAGFCDDKPTVTTGGATDTSCLAHWRRGEGLLVTKRWLLALEDTNVFLWY